MFAIGEYSVVATTVTAIAIIFIFFWRRQSGTKDAGRRFPPAAPALPLLFAILRGGMSVLPDQAMRAAQKLGPVISYNLGGRLVIILNGREAISEAFVRKSDAFADRNEFWSETNVVNPNLRGIIFARYNDVFKKYHKLCLAILKEFGFGINSVSETRILREVESLNEQILKFNGHPFNPKVHTMQSTFNVVASILFGQAFVSSGICQVMVDGIERYVKNTEFAIDFAPSLRFLPYFRGKISALAQSHKDILNGVDKGIEYSRSTECEPTFVKRFIEIQRPDYDHQDLVYIVRDLCLASAETVATTLQWALVELANHPEVQTRFQREVDDVVPKERLPSLDDKPRLPYTEAVILEVMRRHSIVPLHVPHATLKDTEVLGYFVPKGCMVLANAVSAHMDPKSWKDPETFRPERFLDEVGTVIGSEGVIAFGLGKRSCLGEILGRQETFLFLTSLVQRFDIRPPEGQDSISVKEIIGGAMRPSEFKVSLIPRTNTKN